ncbi:MAG: 5-formyltetrahydrofolate cyclo-ligase [Sphingomonadaceae bacterium]|nr:5-formyltetrahydrofolate cyclo-ligase [Sphingomonadaceae bacterium]
MEFDKASQRLKYRQLRDEFVENLTPSERKLAFSRVPSPLRALLQPGKTVAGYIATGSEVDPASLLNEARSMGCKLALPHITSRVAPMRFLRWDPGDQLFAGPFGLSQPSETAEPCDPDVALVPLLAFDARLMRLGQGAGHYDRALSLLDNVIAVGLAWSVQMAPALISDPWDIPMDAVLTEQSWITQ